MGFQKETTNSRREFLKGAGIFVAGLVVAGCTGREAGGSTESTATPEVSLPKALIGVFDNETVDNYLTGAEKATGQQLLDEVGRTCEKHFPGENYKQTVVWAVDTEAQKRFGYGFCYIKDKGWQATNWFEQMGVGEDGVVQMGGVELKGKAFFLKNEEVNGVKYNGLGYQEANGNKRIVLLQAVGNNSLLMTDIYGKNFVDMQPSLGQLAMNLILGEPVSAAGLERVATVTPTVPEVRPTETQVPTPEATAIPIEAVKKEILTDAESKFFKPELAAKTEINVDGVDMKLIFGLMVDTVDEFGIKELKINRGSDYDDQLVYIGRVLLNAGWKNYKAYKDGGISYQNYCKLVQNGGGKMIIGGVDESVDSPKTYDNRTQIEVSPKNAVLLLGGDRVSFPVIYNQFHRGYVGLNKEKTFVLAASGLGTRSKFDSFMNGTNHNLSSEKINEVLSWMFMQKYLEFHLFSLQMSSDMSFVQRYIGGQFGDGKEFGDGSVEFEKELKYEDWLRSFFVGTPGPDLNIKNTAIEVVR